MLSPRWTLALLAAAACGDNQGQPDAQLPPIDAPMRDAPPDADPLQTLAGTGLCADRACTQINPGIREYAPRVSFWDDTATKRRWIYLPPGSKIDTTDMDHWVFPVGTKIWKEFTRDGTRVETRLLMKQLPDDAAPGAWFYATYLWVSTQDGTVSLVDGMKNASGTQHDIPTRAECLACHNRLRPTRVLGFDAIQLDYDAPAGQTDLGDLIAAGLLTTNPTGAAAPRFPLPGTAVDQTALTYLDANCGHCHNPTSDVHDVSPLDLRLRTAAAARSSVAATPAYATAVGQDAADPYFENGINFTKLIIAGDPQHSAVIGRMTSMMGIRFMPAVAVESVDPAGQAALVAWINSL